MKLLIQKRHVSQYSTWNYLLISFLIIALVFAVSLVGSVGKADYYGNEIISLPQPDYYSNVPVEQALLINNQDNNFGDEPVSLKSIAQLLWASKNLATEKSNTFYSRSHACIQTYLVAGNINGLSAGVYQYNSGNHELIKVSDGDKREKLCGTTALLAPCFYNSAASIVFTTSYPQSTAKYAKNENGCIHFKAGYVVQSIVLQAVSLNIRTIIIDVFSEKTIKKILNISAEKQLLYIMPVGKKEQQS